MNKSEAQQAINSGEKVTHPAFGVLKWVTISADGYHYIFYNGGLISPILFWAYHSDYEYDQNWSIWKEHK